MVNRYVVPVAAGSLALSMIGGGFWAANALGTTPVTLTVDGSSQELEVHAATVGEVLTSQGIELGEHDAVSPAPETRLSDHLAIAVQYARPLELTVDGQKTTFWTTATNVSDALAQLKLSADDADRLSISRSASIGREGLAMTIMTAKDVVVTAAGKPTNLSVAGTVGDALAKVGITPDADDIVTPGVDTPLSDGAAIVFQQVENKTVTKTVAVPFEKKTVKSDKLFGDESKVTTKGVDGSATQEVQETWIDGALSGTKVLSSTTVKEAVAEVTTQGTKPRPTATATPAPTQETSTPAADPSLSPASGASCKASYYWQGARTANGESFNPDGITAAHKTLPFNTKVKVTNQANGKSVIVRINDRGPFVAGRCLDLSRGAMVAIDGTSSGVANVTYEVVS